MPMQNFVEYSKNYRKTTGSLRNYYRDEPSNPLFSNVECFKYKTNIIGKTPEDNDSLTDVKVVILLKHLSNFWRALSIPLINCKIELILRWSNKCVLVDMTVDADADSANVALTGAIFKETDSKLYFTIATLSKGNDTKLLEKLKLGFKRTIKWKKYRSQITIQPENSNLNYLIDLTFTNVNRLFILPFKRIPGTKCHNKRLMS